MKNCTFGRIIISSPRHFCNSSYESNVNLLSKTILIVFATCAQQEIIPFFTMQMRDASIRWRMFFDSFSFKLVIFKKLFSTKGIIMASRR